ncbi:Transmembrane protein [Phytophthora nicotianae]|nr:Transmembrane protein [Phytophthora nicotianae]
MFTPAEEKGGILALSVADVILRHIRPWVYLTAGFYHPYIVQLVFVLPLAFGLAKRVEPDLGALNLVRLLLFANTAAAVVMFVNLFILYIIFRNPIYLYEILAVSLMLVSAGPFSVLGGYFGWYYLRFLNKNRDQTVGDVSDEFALVVLLPDFCIPLVSPLANFCFSVVKLCGFFKKRAAQKPKMLPILTEIKNDPIAERRKARAMKALDEKLAKLAHARDDTGASSLLSVEVRDDEN